MGKNKFENEYDALSDLAKGSFAAFNFIYHKYCQLVYGNIYKYVKDASLAEDLLQDVFLTLWENRTVIKCDVSVGGWLFKVSYNKSISLLRSQVKAQLVKADASYLNAGQHSQGDTEEADYQYRISLLEEAVKCLPDKKQKIYRLSKFEHKKPEEISEELGLTVISVKHYLKQSTKLIKQYVQYKYPVEIILLFFSLLMLFS